MVRLKRLVVEGLFSYTERQKAVFSGRTVIVGPNNAGKSNLFRIIDMLADELLRRGNLPTSKTSESDHNPCIEAEISLSPGEIDKLVDFFSCSAQQVHPDQDMILTPDAESDRSCLGSITIKIEWKRVPKGLGVNPRVEIQFPECGFAFRGPLDEEAFPAEPIGGEHKSDRIIRFVQFNAFVKEILESGDPKSSAESFFQARDTIHYAVSFNIDDMDLKTQLRIKDLMRWLDIETGSIALPRVLGTMLKKGIVYATENRNLLQDEVAEMFHRLTIGTSDPDGFGYRYNSELLDMFAYNSLNHTDTLANDGGNIAQFLFSLKNSPDPSDTERYRTIEERFRRMFLDQKLAIEPILEYPVVDSLGYGSRQFPRPRLVVADGHMRERLSLEQVGAGVRGVIYLLAAVYGAKDSVVMLDEPGINLHPAMLREVMEEMEEDGSNNQILITTHSPELLDYEMFDRGSDVIRVGKKGGSVTCGPWNNGVVGEWLKEKREKLKHQIDVGMFFAHLAILVEGRSDQSMLLGVAEYKSKEDSKYNLSRQNIAVIDVHGKDNFEKYGDLLDAYQIPYVILADRDDGNEKHEKTFQNQRTSEFPSDCESRIDADIVLMKNDLEKLLKGMDGEALEEARRIGGKSNVAVAIEFCKIVQGTDPQKLCPFTAFLDYCIGRAPNAAGAAK